ncbi:hypothetical protein DK847_17610 [Aestuariivirga litoralis]|uniref:Uncharacterized protein n=1 Tax=Aestuariivirga litoralis TaxID=2650924 RepID=A0A2W2B6A4_9HYPH|nr:hypothetical protein DK847_17610 [Aestuariivirga litoralis]
MPPPPPNPPPPPKPPPPPPPRAKAASSGRLASKATARATGINVLVMFCSCLLSFGGRPRRGRSRMISI